MPKLIKLYIVHVAIGFGIAAAFLALLLLLDIGGLRHLILDTPMGWLAGLMIFMFSGNVFAGVQFAIAVMRMADPDDGPRGGLRDRLPAPTPEPQPVRVMAPARRR